MNSVLAHLDPAIEQLDTCMDGDRVRSVFTDNWPSATTPASSIQECTLHDVSYRPGQSCTAAWWLDTIVGGRSVRTMGVIEADSEAGPLGFRHRLYQDDRNLAGLDEASNPTRMGGHLSTLLNERLDACQSAVVRYRAGARAVFRYTVAMASSSAERGGDAVLYGKMDAAGPDWLWSTVGGLRTRAAKHHDMPGVAKPLGVVSGLGMVVQHAATGTPLRDRLFGSAATESDALLALFEAGRQLAAFHDSGEPPATSRNLHRDVAATRASLSAVALADPALAEQLAMNLDVLEALELDDCPLVPSHGSFRADHLLLGDDGGQVGDHRATVIDVDGFCASVPERDAANLLAFIEWKAIRQPEYQGLAAQAEKALRAGYRSRRPALDGDRLHSFLSACMLRIAAGRFRNLTVTEWPMVPGLVDAAIALIPGRSAR